MTLSIWLDKRSQAQGARVIEADLAIIGGGVVGAACAHFAAQRNNSKQKLKIVLLDAASPAHGASGRSAGFVLRGIHTYYEACVKKYGRKEAHLIYSLGEENQALMREFMAGREAAFDFDPSGSYLLASSLEEMESLAQSAELMKEDGFEHVLLREDPLDRGFYGALLCRNDFGINPVKLVQNLLLSAAVDVLRDEAVRRIEANGERKVILHTNQGTVICDRAILATNAYSSMFLDHFVDLLTVVRGQMLATAPLKKRLLERLCYANFGWEYFRQLPDRRLLLGGCRQHFAEAEMGYGDFLTRPVQQALEHYLRDRFPEAAGVPIEYRWSGLMAFTADGLPLIGQMPDLPGVYFALGCNGHGLSFNMVLGRAVINFALDGSLDPIFGAGRLLPCGEDEAEGRQLRLPNKMEIGP